nr:type II toxin-antitoxin system RelE/ParE family toxin [Corynebacterium suranareeae]
MALFNYLQTFFGGEDVYRLRMGSYRIIYDTRVGELVILVLSLGHRNDIYWKRSFTLQNQFAQQCSKFKIAEHDVSFQLRLGPCRYCYYP